VWRTPDVAPAAGRPKPLLPSPNPPNDIPPAGEVAEIAAVPAENLKVLSENTIGFEAGEENDGSETAGALSARTDSAASNRSVSNTQINNRGLC